MAATNVLGTAHGKTVMNITQVSSPASSHPWFEAGSRWLEVGGWRKVAGGRWLEEGGWMQVAGGRWLAIHVPLNTAYVSVSTEPPDYNHVHFEVT